MDCGTQIHSRYFPLTLVYKAKRVAISLQDQHILCLLFSLAVVEEESVLALHSKSWTTKVLYSLRRLGRSKDFDRMILLLVGKSMFVFNKSTKFTRFVIQPPTQEEEVMVSFDVISLFTNVSVDLAFAVAHSCLMDYPIFGGSYSTLSRWDFMFTFLQFECHFLHL